MSIPRSRRRAPNLTLVAGDERDRAIPGALDSVEPTETAFDRTTLDKFEAANIQEMPDGSARVIMPREPRSKGDGEFDDNLAEMMDEPELAEIARDLMEKIRRDKDARKKRDDQYEEGLRRTGLGKDAPGGAQFTGASRAVHPMLAEAAVDFEAAAIKELFPPEGPARPNIYGPITQAKLELAERQQRCLNWQLTRKVPEYIPELERVLTQVPMGGTQYQKFWNDPERGWWTTEAVYIDDLYIPFSCADFWSASRITHVQRLTRTQVEGRIDSGMYRDIGAIGDIALIDETGPQKASDKIEGRERIEPDIDNERPVFEVNTWIKISPDGNKRRPYLISIDDATGKVLSIYRNWEESDKRHKRLHWIVDWDFVPWRGAYAVGLPHLIGGLSAAATGALRALLDSGHVNNIPGGLILKGWGMSGQTTTPQATQFSEVQGSSLTTDDIRKIAMPFPFNPPSDTLFKLLGWLTDAAKGVVTTAEEKISDASNTMPVGTALALIEAGAKVFSAIHKRMHRSQMRAFEVIARLCAALPNFEQEQLEDLGEILASPRDFSKSLAVQPASDPEVFSEGQRLAKTQILETQAGKYPQLYNQYAVQRRVLQAARIHDIDEILPPPPKPLPLNAAAENAAAATGTPLLAFPEQAHLAHIMTHLLFVQDPLLGPQGAAGQHVIINLAEHLKQHVTMQYAVLVRMIASEAAGAPIDKFMKEAEEDPRLAQQLDQAIAAAAPRAQQMLAQQLAPVAQTLLKIFQTAAQMKGATAPNPDAVAAATLVDEAARKASESAGNLALKQVKQETDQGNEERKLELAERKQNLAERKQAADEQVDAAEIAQGDAELAQDARHQELQMEEARKPGNQIPGA